MDGEGGKKPPFFLRGSEAILEQRERGKEGQEGKDPEKPRWKFGNGQEHVFLRPEKRARRHTRAGKGGPGSEDWGPSEGMF